jgi:hypothetical protein
LLSFVIIVTFGYQNAIREAEHVFRGLLDRTPPIDAKVREKVLEVREDLMWKGDGGSFILSILKSSSVLVILIASGTAYVVKMADKDNWLPVFVPDPVVDFLHKVFVGPPT